MPRHVFSGVHAEMRNQIRWPAGLPHPPGRTAPFVAAAVLVWFLGGCNEWAGAAGEGDDEGSGTAGTAAPPTSSSLDSILPESDSVVRQRVSPGVHHTSLRSSKGPWGIEILEIDTEACGVELRSVVAGGQIFGRATTSSMTRQAETRFDRPVLAGVNADFFTFEPPGVPLGLQVSSGEIVKSRTTRDGEESPVFGLTVEGAPFIAVIELGGTLATKDGATSPIGRVNRPAGAGIVLYNRYYGEAAPADTNLTRVVVRPLTPARAAGDTVRGVVTELDTSSAGLRFGEDDVVFAGRDDAATFLRSVAPGDTVSWWIELEGAPAPVRSALGGRPRLLEGGEEVHQDVNLADSFARARHPRTAVGWDPNGTLFLVAVDGRQEGYSDGMTLGELSAFFRRLGVTEAINLDGGGSTTMVVDGAVVNRPSDQTGERPVANALVVLGPRDGDCPVDG